LGICLVIYSRRKVLEIKKLDILIEYILVHIKFFLKL